MSSDRDSQNSESINVASVMSVDGTDTVTAGTAASAGLLAQADRRRAAEKLRDKGWSYRRIAENLNIPYILVSKWLSEDALAEPPARRPAEDAPAAPVPPPNPTVRDMDDAADMIETLKLQYGALEGYVQPMLAALEASKAGLDASAADAAKERDQLRAKVTALETTVARLQMNMEQLRADLASGIATAIAAPAIAVAAIDPFAADEDAAASSPFADDPTPAPEEDPFADDPATDAAAPANDPFAEEDPAPAAEPAGLVAAAPDPATGLADPFAEEPAGPTGAFADPFAEEPEATPGVADPFAEDPADPFAEDASAPPEAEPAAKVGMGRLKFWKR